jgi:hypothetical protein
MGRVRVLRFELRSPNLGCITVHNRFNTGEETAFLNEQFVMGWAGNGKRHAEILLDVQVRTSGQQADGSVAQAIGCAFPTGWFSRCVT